METYESEPKSLYTNAVEPALLRAGLKLAAIVGAIEGYLCVLFSVFATLCGGLICLSLFQYSELPTWKLVAAAAWTVGFITLDFPYVAKVLLIALRRQHPFALTAAREANQPPPLLRPVITFWWLIHFAVGAFAASIIHSLAAPNLPHLWGYLLVGFFVGLAANGFLMLAIFSATSSNRLRMQAWRWRLLIDISFMIAGTIIFHLHATKP